MAHIMMRTQQASARILPQPIAGNKEFALLRCRNGRDRGIVMWDGSNGRIARTLSVPHSVGSAALQTSPHHANAAATERVPFISIPDMKGL